MKRLTRETPEVIVIGAGAAGMMAAGVCAGNGKRVLVIEKNDITGRKIRISGKGRCNVTNNCEPTEVIAAVPGDGRFLFSALNAFSPQDTMRFFEERDVPLKTERGRRVFPVSDSARDIAQALESFVRDSGADIIKDTAEELIIDGQRCIGVRTGQGEYRAQAVIVACGGSSYPATGSNGDGVRLAVLAGHTVTPPSPSLVPLVAKGEICQRLQGLSLKNCGVSLVERDSGKRVYEDFGELLFTHFGLSGPTILSASAHMKGQSRYIIEIDLKPALDLKTLDLRLRRDLEKNKNKNLGNSLGELLPQKLIAVFTQLAELPNDIKCHSVTREQRRRMCEVLKSLQIEIEGTRPIAEAIVTRGGVKTNEIDPKTMESKKIKGLYFAGEVIDVDGYTGGFNLQIAFSTGYAAGNAPQRTDTRSQTPEKVRVNRRFPPHQQKPS